MKKRITTLCLLFVAFVLIVGNGCTPKDNNEYIYSLITKYVNFWNSGNFTGAENVFSTDLNVMSNNLPNPLNGIDSFKEWVSNCRKEFPDFSVKLDEILYSDNRVAAKYHYVGTSSMAPVGSAPVNVTGMAIFHFSEGKIKDVYHLNDNLSLKFQLGYKLLPTQPPVAPIK